MLQCSVLCCHAMPMPIESLNKTAAEAAAAATLSAKIRRVG
jgi:hypothetical protein